MHFKFFLIFAVFAVVVPHALCASITTTVEPNELAEVPEGDGSLQRNMRMDLFETTRRIINNIATRLNRAASEANKLIQDILNRLEGLREGVRNTITNGTVKIINQVEKAIGNITTNVPCLSNAILQCFNSQRNNVNGLITKTVNDVNQCITSQVEIIMNLLADGTLMAAEAMKLARDVYERAGRCGIADFNNMLIVGKCLNTLLTSIQPPANQLISRMMGTGAITVATMAGLPIQLSVCTTNALAEASNKVTIIINDVARCANSPK